MNINNNWFYVFYGIFSILGMYCYIHNPSLNLACKAICWCSLLLLYTNAVPKQKREKKYLILLVLTLIGQVLFMYTDLIMFTYVILCYSISHLLLSYIFYKKNKNISLIDMVIFSLPYLFVITLFEILDLNLYWKILCSFGVLTASINGSIVLQNYIKRSSISNYLFFYGTCLWLVVDFIGSLYMFNEKNELYYLLVKIADNISQFIICLGFIYAFKEEKELISE